MSPSCDRTLLTCRPRSATDALYVGGADRSSRGVLGKLELPRGSAVTILPPARRGLSWLAMTLETLLSLKAPLLAGGALVFFLTYERLWPAVDSPLLLRLGRARRAAWRRLARNVTLFGINLALSPLVVLPITVWATGFQLGLRPGWWHGWQGLLLDLVLLDFGSTGGIGRRTRSPGSGAFTRSITWTSCSTARALCGSISARWCCRHSRGRP